MSSTDSTRFNRVLKHIEGALLALIGRLGPFFVALVPAMFTAFSVYSEFIEDEKWIRISFAIITAIGIEVSGIKVIHTAVDMHRARSRAKARIMTFASFAYAFIVATIIIYAGDAFSPLIRGLGAGSPFLAMIVYLAVAYSREVEATDVVETIEAVDAKRYRREQKELDKERAHELAVISASRLVSSDTSLDTSSPSKETKLETATRAILESGNVPDAFILSSYDVSRATLSRAKRHVSANKNGVK